MPVSTPKYKNLFCQTLKKQVLIRGFLLYHIPTPLYNGDFPLLQAGRFGELTYITNYIPRHNSKLDHSICLWLYTFEFLSGFTWLYLRLESCEW